MSAEKARAPSPASGRDSPAGRLRRQLDDGATDSPKAQDKTYRRYAAGIEKSLALVESGALEWPDYISFLGRLLKAIQAHPADADSLPHKTLVAHRLSQCLTPALPSGVHQKALEVYGAIFELVGKDGLGRDLAVFLPGMASVLTFASLSLHTPFLDLIQTHILPLNAHALRPALRALILCLLPGLEDETSEEFERTLKVIDGLRLASSVPNAAEKGTGEPDEYFWQCMFLATIGSSSRRPGALAFLIRRLPHLGPIDISSTSNGEASALHPASKAVVSPEPGLLIRCFAVGLQDDQPLIQRGYLDLLLSRLPLNSPVLTKLAGSLDLQILVTAAVGVVARRDMSLNRRLWAWFLGPKASEEEDDSANVSSPTETMDGSVQKTAGALFFDKYGVEPLTKTLLAMFSQHRAPPLARARPYRITLSLLDRSEIGGPLISRLFVPAMNMVFVYQISATDGDAQEVLRSASSFFDGIESGVIWGEIQGLVQTAFTQAVNDADAAVENIKLVKFILTSFNTREEEMLVFHMPLVCVLLLDLINAQTNLDERFVKEALLVADKMASYLPERAKLNDSFSSTQPEETLSTQLRRKIINFYTESKGNISLSPPPFSSRQTAVLLLKESAACFCAGLAHSLATIHIRARVLSTLLSKIPKEESLDVSTLAQTSLHVVNNSLPKDSQVAFGALTAITHVFSHLATTRDLSLSSGPSSLAELLSSLTKEFWPYLTPVYPRHHVETVRCLWQIDEVAKGGRLVEATIANFLVAPQRGKVQLDRTEMAQRFAVLWTHATQSSGAGRKGGAWSLKGHGVQPQQEISLGKEWYHTFHRPLCLLLDGLVEEGTELKYFLTSWLTSLPNIDVILDMILQTELSQVRQLRKQLASLATNSSSALQAQHHDTTPQCLYYMRHLLNLLRLSSENVASALSRVNEISGSAEDGELAKEARHFDGYIALQCLRIIRLRPITSEARPSKDDVTLQCTCLSVMQQLMKSPKASSLQRLGLDVALIDTLREYLARGTKEPSLQVALLDTILVSLKLQALETVPETPLRSPSINAFEMAKTMSRTSLQPDEPLPSLGQRKMQPPKQLVACIEEGISHATSFYVLERWIQFLIDILPLYVGTLFQNLIPLVECLCRQINHNFRDLQGVFHETQQSLSVSPDSSLLALLEGLEHILAVSHDQLTQEESKAQSIKSPEPSQGFFGNVVSGVFTTEAHKTGRAAANTRLTVLLCFQDAVRICLSIWSWGSYGDDRASRNPTMSASFSYSSVRLRNRARRILDRVFAVESLECLETIVAAWCRPGHEQPGVSALQLLHVLDASQPKVTMPALFNSIYSRTNPAALEAHTTSSLTSDLSIFELGRFLLDYTSSLDDDAMDEVWSDCMTFLRDILSNPLPHSQILPCLLPFLIILAEKVENTNFGEQRKIRKELSDLFTKVLAATVTTRTAAGLAEPALAVVKEENQGKRPPLKRRASVKVQLNTIDYVEMLGLVVPKMDVILVENDRQLSAAGVISAHAIAPALQSKQFPDSLRISQLELIARLSKVPATAKVWRKDAGELFGHAKLFSCSVEMVNKGIMPILRSWALVEKDRFADLLGRIAAPTAAGIMFGVGASAARTDADKKTQLNLRRVALLVLASATDAGVTSYSVLEEKLNELLGATSASSPSAMTRAEVFMVLQVVVLRASPVHLASLWPMISNELQRAISSALPRSPEYDMYNVPSLVQACKLLDLLLLVAPDEFQLHEWVFITDTIDAVYRSTQYDSTGLVDDLAEELGSFSLSPNVNTSTPSEFIGGSAVVKRPLFKAPASVSEYSKDDLVKKVLQPFFAQLSIHTYESTYGLGKVDLDAVEQSLLVDLFDDTTLVG